VHELSANRSAQQLTFSSNNRAPAWSPDGLSIAFQSDLGGDEAMYVQRGWFRYCRATEQAGSRAGAHSAVVVAGRAHLLFSVQKGNEFTLWSMTLSDRKAVPFGGVAAREAAFSPDGRWVVYQVREENANVAYVEPFPRTGAKYLVSRALWSGSLQVRAWRSQNPPSFRESVEPNKIRSLPAAMRHASGRASHRDP
jgi:Tol biopolymer transport system component